MNCLHELYTDERSVLLAVILVLNGILHFLQQIRVETLTYFLSCLRLLVLKVCNLFEQVWQLTLRHIFDRRIVNIYDCVGQVGLKSLDAHNPLF